MVETEQAFFSICIILLLLKPMSLSVNWDRFMRILIVTYSSALCLLHLLSPVAFQQGKRKKFQSCS